MTQPNASTLSQVIGDSRSSRVRQQEERIRAAVARSSPHVAMALATAPTARDVHQDQQYNFQQQQQGGVGPYASDEDAEMTDGYDNFSGAADWGEPMHDDDDDADSGDEMHSSIAETIRGIDGDVIEHFSRLFSSASSEPARLATHLHAPRNVDWRQAASPNAGLSILFVAQFLNAMQVLHRVQDSAFDSILMLLRAYDKDGGSRLPVRYETIQNWLRKLNIKEIQVHYCTKCYEGIFVRDASGGGGSSDGSSDGAAAFADTPCPKCSHVGAIGTYAYTTLTSILRLLFQHDPEFVRQMDHLRTEVTKSEQWTDWHNSGVGAELLRRFSPTGTVFLRGATDGMALYNSNTPSCYPLWNFFMNMSHEDRNRSERMVMSALLDTPRGKTPSLDILLIPWICELLYYMDHKLRVYNCVTQREEEYNLALVDFLSDGEARREILKATSASSYDICDVCNVVGEHTNGMHVVDETDHELKSRAKIEEYVLNGQGRAFGFKGLSVLAVLSPPGTGVHGHELQLRGLPVHVSQHHQQHAQAAEASHLAQSPSLVRAHLRERPARRRAALAHAAAELRARRRVRARRARPHAARAAAGRGQAQVRVALAAADATT